MRRGGNRRGALALALTLIVSATGCTGTLARMMVEPSAGGELIGGRKSPFEGNDEFREQLPRAMDATVLRVRGAGSAELHALAFEPRDYDLSWRLHRDGESFELEFEFRGAESAGDPPQERAGTVILLHGLQSEGLQLLPQALALAEAGYRTVLPDLRAHGASEGRYVTYGVRERRDVIAVLDTLRGRGLVEGQVVLFGTSPGASVALQAAARARSVDRVVAVAPFADPRDVIRRNGRRMLPSPLRSLVGKDRVEAAMERAEQLAGFDFDEASSPAYAADVGAPVLLIHSREDDFVPFEHSERLHRMLRCSTLRPVEGRGHGLTLLDPDVTAAPVVTWLRSGTRCPPEEDRTPPFR